MAKAIIFDLWETIASKGVGVSGTLRERFNIPKTPDFLERYERSVQLFPWPEPREMADSFLKEFGVDVTPENIEFVVKVFGSFSPSLYPGMKELLQALREKYKLGLLSNTTVFEADLAVRTLDLDQLFDQLVFSWQISSLKPAPLNFEVMLQRLGTTPEETIFIDDSLKCVESARALGLTAIRFEGIDQLRKDLEA